MHPSRRRTLIALAFSSPLLPLALAAPCTALAHEYFTTRFTLIHPWTRATAPGSDTAKICMTFDEVTGPDRLVGASSPMAASAVVVSPGEAGGIAIAPDRKTVLDESGPHVRLVGLREPLVLGRELPITLLFEATGALKASFLVDYEAL